MKQTLTLLLLLNFNCSFTQGWYPSGARSMSMANSTVAISDVWAFSNNPGALADLKEINIGASYENRFLLKELQSQSLVFAHPLKYGVASVGTSLFGRNNYLEYKVGFGYSLKLTEKLFSGVQMNIHGVRLSDYYGTNLSPTAEAGILYFISSNWKIGASIFNISRTKLSTFQDDRFSTIMRFGALYDVSDICLITLESEMSLGYALRIKSGVEYKVANQLCLRGGVATNPVGFSFGGEYQVKKVHIGFGSAYDQFLGWSPHFSVRYTGNRVK